MSLSTAGLVKPMISGRSGTPGVHRTHRRRRLLKRLKTWLETKPRDEITDLKLGFPTWGACYAYEAVLHLHLHLGHLADAFIQSDLQ
jgi:hypothetical protein